MAEDRWREALEEHDRWDDAHAAARHSLIDRQLAPHWMAEEIRFKDLESRMTTQERRGDKFDAVIATIRIQAVVLGVLITAFGSAILVRLGVI
jgi:hypothetical protein